MYLFNLSWVGKSMYSVAKPFIAESTRRKIQIVDLNNILQDMDINSMPKELGGRASYTLDEAFDATVQLLES